MQFTKLLKGRKKVQKNLTFPGGISLSFALIHATKPDSESFLGAEQFQLSPSKQRYQSLASCFSTPGGASLIPLANCFLSASFRGTNPLTLNDINSFNDYARNTF